MSILATETIELINAQKKDIESSFTSVQEVTNYLITYKIQTETVANFSVIDANIRLKILIDLTKHYSFTKPEDDNDTSFIAKLKLAILAIIGTAYHICNGFAGGTCILSLFLGIPGWVILAVGIFLSLVYLLLFLYIDLATISENLKVKFFKSRKLIDIYIEQEVYLRLLIQNIKRQIRENNDKQVLLALEKQHNNKIIEETQELQNILEVLIAENENLAKIANAYHSESKKCYVRTLKLIFPLFTDALFFSYGFFTGEAMIQIIGAAFGTFLSGTSGAGVILCIFAGLAALSLYWLNDRLSVENLVGIWVGLDLKKIELLPKQKIIVEDQSYLTSQQNITRLLRHSQFQHVTPQESTELSTGLTMVQPNI